MTDITTPPRIKGSWLYAEGLHIQDTRAIVYIDYDNKLYLENRGEIIYCYNTKQEFYFEILKTNLGKDYLQLYCPLRGYRVQHLTFDPIDRKFKRSRDLIGGYYSSNRRSKLQRSLDAFFYGNLSYSNVEVLSKSKVNCLIGPAMEVKLKLQSTTDNSDNNF